jgi:hypothetical protein
MARFTVVHIPLLYTICIFATIFVKLIKNHNQGSNIMWGYTIIGRDGGEVYTSEPEYDSEVEAYKAGDLTLCDMNEGSVEVWQDL